jgi:heme A synthase
MKKNTALKIINPILFISIINQLMTGFFRMKLSRETFEVLHEGGAIILAGLVTVHIILNFNWIKANYFHK